MIKIKVLPDGKIVEIKREKISVEELLETMDLDDPDSYALIIDGELVDPEADRKRIISGKNKILLIRQATGG